MARRILTAALSGAIALAAVAPTSRPAGAQDALPGVVATGRYGEGALGTAKQPTPDPGATGAVYGVGSWPSYTPPLADGANRNLVIGVCSVCHSTTYITMQPALPAAAWTAIVDKMIKTFGASIPEDVARQVTQYLQAHYTPETRR